MNMKYLSLFLIVLLACHKTLGDDEEASSSSSASKRQRISSPERASTSDTFSDPDEQHLICNGSLLFMDAHTWREQGEMPDALEPDEVRQQLREFVECEQRLPAYSDTVWSPMVKGLMEMDERAKRLLNNEESDYCNKHFETNMRTMKSWLNEYSQTYPLLRNFATQIHDQILGECFSKIKEEAKGFLDRLNELQVSHAVIFHNFYQSSIVRLQLFGINQADKKVERLGFAEAAAQTISMIDDEVDSRSNWPSQAEFEAAFETEANRVMSQICDEHLNELGAGNQDDWVHKVLLLDELKLVGTESLDMFIDLWSFAKLSGICKFWVEHQVNARSVLEAHQRIELDSDGMEAIRELNEQIFGITVPIEDVEVMRALLLKLHNLYVAKQEKLDTETYAVNIKELEFLMDFKQEILESQGLLFTDQVIENYEIQESMNIVVYLESVRASSASDNYQLGDADQDMLLGPEELFKNIFEDSTSITPRSTFVPALAPSPPRPVQSIIDRINDGMEIRVADIDQQIRDTFTELRRFVWGANNPIVVPTSQQFTQGISDFILSYVFSRNEDLLDKFNDLKSFAKRKSSLSQILSDQWGSMQCSQLIEKFRDLLQISNVITTLDDAARLNGAAVIGLSIAHLCSRIRALITSQEEDLNALTMLISERLDGGTSGSSSMQSPPRSAPEDAPKLPIREPSVDREDSFK